jgi:hypothetical protein
MRERLYVRLDESDVKKIKEIARAERRHPSDQGGLMIARALREAEAKRRSEGTPDGGAAA